jgi:hypothetical protein
MIRADENRKGSSQVEFSLTVLDGRPLRLKTVAVAADLAQPVRRSELNLSGSQLLVGVSVFWTVSFLIWALLKLWLFE